MAQVLPAAADVEADLVDAVENSEKTIGTDKESGNLSDHVIVCGLGHVGYRIARMLIRLGQRGVIVALSVRKDWQAAVESHFTVIVGDAREDELLCQAGIQRAKAILAVTDDDLANVSIALDARRLNPQIAVTIRMFDQNLAAHLEETTQVHRALSTSALAVPAFTAAALGGPIQGAFETEGTQWIIETDDVASGNSPENATIAQASRGIRVPIAMERGQELTIRPGPDVRIASGDRLTFLSPRPGGDDGPAPVSLQKGRRAARARALIAGVREWWRETPMALRITLFAMTVLIVVSVFVCRLALDISFVDATYFVISTITTVGYGDYSFHDASPGMKLYGCVLMLCGVAILAVIVSLVTDLILQTRLRDVIARGSARFKGHIIVAGLGNIGFRLVQSLLQNGEQVVAIEHRKDGEFVQTARELVPVVLGNAKMEETLRKAGAAGAKVLLAVTDDDIANLSISLAAKRTRPDCRIVTRIFDSALAEKMEHALGLDAVLSVSAASAPTFIGSILCPGVLQGIVLRNYLVLVFHRIMGCGPLQPGMPDGSLAENEAALWVKPVGAAAYRVATADDRIGKGDQVVGLWWRPFA
ncbi:MAG: NAD-binding protein [Thermoguttaceae bacterium]